jgi:cytochrome c oxidase subunit 2
MWRLCVAALPLLVTGCEGVQSVLDPAGPQAGRIAGLWWFMLAVCSVVFILVVASLLAALMRRSRHNDDIDDTPEIAPDPERERRMKRVVVGATVVTTVILFIFLIADFSTGRELNSLKQDSALTVKITGHQWWWEVRYLDPTPSRQITTANELHIPVGRPMRLLLTADDVIHSFWAPNLHGKKDLIPGYTSETWIEAERPGVYRGECAEFCGLEHAKMAFDVIVEPADSFARWANAQRAVPPPPTDPTALRGQEVFLAAPCPMCHNISGTTATGQVAPDLTHLASRRTIAAGTLPNTRGHLAGWIVDPQTIKPGVKMPPNLLAPEELQSLLSYLETLK